MLGKEILLKLNAYGQRADLRLLDVAEKLSDEQLKATKPYSHGDLLSLFFHVYRTYWIWRNLAQGVSDYSARPRQGDYTTIAKLRLLCQEEHRLMQSYLQELDEQQLAANVQVQDPRGKDYTMLRWHMLMQPLTHGVQHRSEIAAILTEYGQSPGDLDFIFFV